jgi:hypothetical protein
MSFPTSGTLTLQAALWSSGQLTNPIVSNVIREDLSPCLPELHYGFARSLDSSDNKIIWITRIDVDHGTTAPVFPQGDNIGYANWSLYPGVLPPARSGDGRFVIIPIGMNYNGFGTSAMYLFDEQSETGRVLAQPVVVESGVNYQYWIETACARFQPGSTDRVWVLARAISCYSNQYEYRMCCYDTSSGALVAAYPLSGDVTHCLPGAIGRSWDFDATGQFVCFNDDQASLIVYPMLGGVPGVGVTLPLDSSGVTSGGTVEIMPIPNSTRGLISYYAGSVRRVVEVDFATGARSAIFTGPSTSGAIIGAIARDGTYAVLEQLDFVVGGPRDLLVVDTELPVISDMPLTATAVPFPYGTQTHPFAVGQGGDIVVGDQHGYYPWLKLSLDGSHHPVSNLMDATTEGGWIFVLLALLDPVHVYDLSLAGQFTALDTRNGLLVQTQSPSRLDLFDLETMTHAALGFTTNEPSGGSIPTSWLGELIF